MRRPLISELSTLLLTPRRKTTRVDSLGVAKMACAALVFCGAAAITSLAQTFAPPAIAASHSALTGKPATGLSSLRVEDAAAPSPLVTGVWVEEAEPMATNAATDDFSGWSVALDGSTLVVGAYRKGSIYSNPNQGAVYIFTQSGGTWNQQAELLSSDGSANDFFGASVALSGGTLVVGAPGHKVGSNAGQGAAYVFVQSGTTWTQQAELISSDGDANDSFGQSVAVSGSTAVVGAVYHPFVNSQYGPGVAYVFTQNGTTWTQQAELTASDGAPGNYFGFSVAVSGSAVLAGAPYHTSNSNQNEGAVYEFAPSGDTWVQELELIPSDGTVDSQFGTSLAVSGTMLVVGAPGQLYPGAAYVFDGSSGSWVQDGELADGVTGDGFAHAVAVSNGTVLVGAFAHTVGPNQSQGAAYVFAESGDTWSEQAVLTAADGAYDDWFGNSVALSGSTGVVGAPQHAAGSNLGAAYVFGPSATTVTLSRTSLSFGDQAVDTTSTARAITLTNTGTATLDIGNLGITLGDNFTIASSTCASTLEAGRRCTVKLTFTPTALGAATGTLTFVDNGTGSPQTVALSGTGEAQTTLTPASFTFAKTKVGDTSTAHDFVLRNNLPTTLTGMTYPTTGPFAVSASTCGTTVDSKKTCTLSVTFSPTQTGTATGTLSVTDSANNSPQVSNLAGTGD